MSGACDFFKAKRPPGGATVMRSDFEVKSCGGVLWNAVENDRFLALVLSA
jgi:hypothetical protein